MAVLYTVYYAASIDWNAQYIRIIHDCFGNIAQFYRMSL